MKKLRVAVIGAGHLGRIHARLLQSLDQVELIGVVDPLAEARQSLAGELKVATLAHHDELPADTDAAVLAAPTDQHYPIGRDLLARGVHLLVEKPLTASLAEASELVSLAQAKGLILQVGHVERFNPAWVAMAPYVRHPRYIEAVRTSGYTFRSTDVGVVLDLMIHDLDLALAAADSQVVGVDAIGVTVFGPHEDLAHAHLRFASGCVANLNASRTSFVAQRAMQIVTDRVYLGIDFAASQAKIVQPRAELLRGQVNVHALTRAEKERVRENLFTEWLPLKEIAVEKRNAIQDEQQEFADCIQTGRAPRVAGAQALECLAVVERILSSIAANRGRSRRQPQPTPGFAPPRIQPDWPGTTRRRKAG